MGIVTKTGLQRSMQRSDYIRSYERFGTVHGRTSVNASIMTFYGIPEQRSISDQVTYQRKGQGAFLYSEHWKVLYFFSQG